MSNEVLEYVDRDNIDRIIQDFGDEQQLHIWLNKKEGYDDGEIEVIAEISDNLWINHFETDPQEWLDFVYEDITDFELRTRAERLQNTLTILYAEKEIPYMENELEMSIYDDYCRWFESKFNKESDYDNLRVSVKILFNYDTAFDLEDLIDARRIIRDNM